MGRDAGTLRVHVPGLGCLPQPPRPAVFLAHSPLPQLSPLPAGLQVDYPTFAELYADIFSPIQPLISQQQLLAAAGWPTYLLSNCR